MEYREIAPVPPLAIAVRCLWVLEGSASEAGDPEPILPDGRPELVLHFGDPFERLEADGRRVVQPAVILAGQVTGPLMLRPTGRAAVLGIRFTPFGAAALLSLPQQELTGLTIDVGDVSPPLRAVLEGVLHHAASPLEAVEQVQRLLVRWIQPSRIDPRVRFAVAAIDRAHGILSIDGLADVSGTSRRQLERYFLNTVGIGPKRLARIRRFQHALQILQDAGRFSTGAQTAAACGYADQSHFIREFHEMAGTSPSDHLLRSGEMTGFFVDNNRSQPIYATCVR